MDRTWREKSDNLSNDFSNTSVDDGHETVTSSDRCTNRAR